MQTLKQNITWLWQNAEKILIVIFFLTFTLNIRKVFLTPYSFLNGGFNEYTTMSFSWADLLMIGIIIIYNIKLLISQFRQAEAAHSLLENVIQIKSSVIRNYYRKNVSRETLYLLLILGWTGLSIFWSQYRPIAIYRFLTLAEIVFFAFVAIKCLKNGKWLNLAIFALVFNGLFQSLLGIAQFIHNGSLGIHFLGESIIGSNIDGVAKILINGEKHIRAYGTFPHPNILAGFLIIPLFLILAEFAQRWFLPTSSHPTPSLLLIRGGGLTDHFPLLDKERARVRCNKVSHETLLAAFPDWTLSTMALITGSGFILTFSRSAFLGLFLGLLVYILWIAHSRDLIEKFISYYKFSIFFIITLILIAIISMDATSIFSNQSLQERQLYQHVSYETISIHPVAGVGIGQFVFSEYLNRPNLQTWQYQPVHNIYLLIFSELGAVGFVLFLLFLISMILRIYKNKKNRGDYNLTYIAYYCIMLSFLVISLFDHYFWDINLGLLTFALPLIILYTEMKKNHN